MLGTTKKENIIKIICSAIETKLVNYKPESHHMPFHHHLLGHDRMALFSFVQSLNTTFGVSIFEPVAKELAKDIFEVVETQYKLSQVISDDAQQAINDVMNKLSVGAEMTRKEIDKIILPKSLTNKTNILKTARVDIFLKNKKNVYLIDLKTVKPNASNFMQYKRQLLEWASIYHQQDRTRQPSSFIALPYNPYHPEPYKRWTMKGMIDLQDEIKIAEEFWNFLAGENIYENLLDCFLESGKILRPALDRKFKEFK